VSSSRDGTPPGSVDGADEPRDTGRHVALRPDGSGATFYLHRSDGRHNWTWSFDNPMLAADTQSMLLINRAMFFMELASDLPHGDEGHTSMTNEGTTVVPRRDAGYNRESVPDLPGWPWEQFAAKPEPEG
jgi:hypothetical protein